MNTNMPNDQNNDDITMEQDEIVGGNQPSMTEYFPQANNSTVEEFQRDFHTIGKHCVTNPENGLLPECDAIMGFFCRAAEQGYKIQIDNLSPLGMHHMSNAARKIPNSQNNSPQPHWDNNDVELLPTVIVTAMAVKSRHSAMETSFFTGLCEAFKFMMEHKLTNKGCK